MKQRIAIIGAGMCGPKAEAVTERLGLLIARSGFDLACGGRFDVRRAASQAKR